MKLDKELETLYQKDKQKFWSLISDRFPTLKEHRWLMYDEKLKELFIQKLEN